MHKVLAIETSCDETSVSIVSNIGDTFKIHSNIIASQIEDHSKWGGVVPELAARKHLELLPFVLDKALEESKIKIEEVDYCINCSSWISWLFTSWLHNCKITLHVTFKTIFGNSSFGGAFIFNSLFRKLSKEILSYITC